MIGPRWRGPPATSCWLSPGRLVGHTPLLARAAAEARRTGKVVFEDLYRDPVDGRLCLALLAPLPAPSQAAPPYLLVLRIDPSRFLYPAVSRWPVPSDTAETLIARRDGESALFLNDLRFQPETALRRRVPLSSVQMPIVQAVLGTRGPFRGVDYRGEAVLSHLAGVPDSPWVVVARIDLPEVFAPLAETRRTTLLLVASLLLALIAVVALLWRRQRTRHYRALYQASEVARREHERAQQYLDIVGSIVIALDDQCVVTLINRVGCELLGYQESEIVGRPWFDHFVPERARRTGLAGFARILQELSPEHRYGTSSVLTRDGRERLVSWQGTLLRDQAGRPNGLLASGQDITERKAEEARLAAILRSAPIGIGVVADQVFRLVNPGLCAITGYEEGELLGMGARLLYLDDAEYERVGREQSGRAVVGETVEVRTHWRRKDGGSVEVAIAGTLLSAADRLHGGVFTVVDVTRQQAAERALRASEARYRHLFQELTAGFALHEIVYDESGRPCDYRWLEVNPAFEALTGLKASEVVGKRALEVIPDLEPRWIEDYGAVATTGEPRQFEQYAAGLDRYYEVRAYRPAPGQFAVIFWDVTERRRMREQALLHAARLEALVELQQFEQASEADSVGYCLYAALRSTRSSLSRISLLDPGEGLLRIYSWSPGPLGVGEEPGRPTELPLAGAGLWEECVRQRRPLIVEGPGGDLLPGADPALPSVELRRVLCVPVFDGSAVRALVAVANKTEAYDTDDSASLAALVGKMWGSISRRRQDHELQEAARRLARAEEMGHLGHWNHDWSRGHIAWSDEMARIHGLTRQTAPQTTDELRALMHPDDRGRFADLLQGDEPLELRILRPDGEVRHLLTWAETVYDEAGDPPRDLRRLPRCHRTRSQGTRTAGEEHGDGALHLHRLA